jgi:hypothetical protein
MVPRAGSLVRPAGAACSALHPRGTPDRKPPAQVGLDVQIGPDRAAYLKFERIVPVLAGLWGKG